MLDCVNVVKRCAYLWIAWAEWQRQVHMDEDGSRSDCPG